MIMARALLPVAFGVDSTAASVTVTEPVRRLAFDVRWALGGVEVAGEVVGDRVVTGARCETLTVLVTVTGETFTKDLGGCPPDLCGFCWFFGNDAVAIVCPLGDEI